MPRRFGSRTPSKPMLTDLVFFDMEASGLHVDSYPIQLGWTKLDLVPASLLVRRPKSWTDTDWNPESEKIHGISRTVLETEGLDPLEVAERFHDAVDGCILVSDAVDYERMWLNKLLRETGCEGMPDIRDLYEIVGSVLDATKMPVEDALRLMEAVLPIHPHTHRADDDAVSMAAQVRILYDADFRASVAAGASSAG